MPRSHFRLWGIPVRIDPTFALVALFGLGTGSIGLGVSWVAIVFVTTLVHELGHAFAFRRYGRGSFVTLWAFGGLTQGEGPPLERGKSIAVSLAGPFAGMLLLGVPALLVQSAFEPSTLAARHVLDLFIWVSIAWSAVNLLPVIPLDGGHVSMNVLDALFGVNGVRAAYLLSMAVAAAGGAYAISRGFTFAALYGAFFIMQNARDLAGLRDAQSLEAIRQAHESIDAGRYDAAARLAQKALAEARNDSVRALAVEAAAWGHLGAGRREAAGTVVQSLPGDRRPSRSLLAAFLVADGHREAAVEAAAEAFASEDPPSLQLARELNRAGLADDVAARIAQKDDDAGRHGAAVLAAHLEQVKQA